MLKVLKVTQVTCHTTVWVQCVTCHNTVLRMSHHLHYLPRGLLKDKRGHLTHARQLSHKIHSLHKSGFKTHTAAALGVHTAPTRTNTGTNNRHIS